jgi:two-component system response regulator
MNQKINPLSILIVDDDEDDYLLILEALKEAGMDDTAVHWVKDGIETLEYLSSRLNGNNGSSGQLPSVILLDLNMPRKDGREALKEIKSDPSFRKIPVIIMTTSSADMDVTNSYDLGVNSFIQKPDRFQDLVEIVRTVFHYWLHTVKLPG